MLQTGQHFTVTLKSIE